MIPYIKIPSIPIVGPLTLHPFGLLVATGILVGSWFSQRRADQTGVPQHEIRGAVLWAVLPGFVWAHWVSMLFYRPDRILDEGPLVMLYLWDGISSFGGFFGALVGVSLFFGPRTANWGMRLARFVVGGLLVGALVGEGIALIVRSLSEGAASSPTTQLAWLKGALVGGSLGCIYDQLRHGRTWIKVADVLAQALVVGWVFGRAGCSVAHDHPGRLSQFLLAIDYPEGARHNLGFYEFLYTLLVMLPVALIVFRWRPRPGVMLGVICALYAPVRFFLDFLRATDKEHSDTRYLGLTPGQYSALLLLAFALFVLVRALRRPAAAPLTVDPVAPAPEVAAPLPSGPRKKRRA